MTVGDWVIVRGQGPMLLMELPSKGVKNRRGGWFPDGVSFRLRQGVNGFDYWAGERDIMRPVDKDFLDNFEKDAKGRITGYEFINEARAWLANNGLVV